MDSSRLWVFGGNDGADILGMFACRVLSKEMINKGSIIIICYTKVN